MRCIHFLYPLLWSRILILAQWHDKPEFDFINLFKKYILQKYTTETNSISLGKTIYFHQLLTFNIVTMNHKIVKAFYENTIFQTLNMAAKNNAQYTFGQYRCRVERTIDCIDSLSTVLAKCEPRYVPGERNYNKFLIHRL